jgi:hypothetical protein
MSLIRFLWQQQYELWQKRCQDVHGTEKTLGSNQERREAKAKITAMYSQASRLPAEDRHIFDVPLPERLSESTRHPTSWVKSLYPAVQQCIKEANSRIRLGHRDIRSFFKRKKNTTTTAAPSIPSPDGNEGLIELEPD